MFIKVFICALINFQAVAAKKEPTRLETLYLCGNS